MQVTITVPDMLMAITIGRVRERRVTEKSFSLNDYIRESLMEKIHRTKPSRGGQEVRMAIEEAGEQFSRLTRKSAAKLLMQASANLSTSKSNRTREHAVNHEATA